MNRKLIFLMATALTLSACSNDSEPGSEIRLFTEVATQTRAANDPAALQQTQFANGTQISVQVTDKAATNPVAYPLAQYTADGAGGLTPSGAKQYFPASGSKVDVYAYHPAGAAQAFSVATDQSANAGYLASDLMWASLAGISNASTAEQCRLSFTHLLSKIVVQLVQGPGFTADDLSATSITLGAGALITSGTFAAATGTFTAAASGTGTITVATNAGTAEHAAIVVPQAMDGKKITLTFASQSSNYTIAEGVTFEPGKKYTYKLKVGTSGITLVSSQISDWDDNDGGNTTTPDPLFII